MEDEVVPRLRADKQRFHRIFLNENDMSTLTSVREKTCDLTMFLRVGHECFLSSSSIRIVMSSRLYL